MLVQTRTALFEVLGAFLVWRRRVNIVFSDSGLSGRRTSWNSAGRAVSYAVFELQARGVLAVVGLERRAVCRWSRWWCAIQRCWVWWFVLCGNVLAMSCGVRNMLSGRSLRRRWNSGLEILPLATVVVRNSKMLGFVLCGKHVRVSIRDRA